MQPAYTTGTTGRPKGVYYSHRNVYLHTMGVISNAEVSMRDCFFQILPIFHVLGWGSTHAATMVDAKHVLSGMYSLDRLGELGEILVQEKVTVASGAAIAQIIGFMCRVMGVRKLQSNGPKPEH